MSFPRPASRFAPLALAAALVALPSRASAGLQDPPPPAPEELFAPLSFEEARARAKEEKKYVMVYWWQVENDRCRTMEEITWMDPEVRKWVSSVAVALSIEGEKNLKVSQSFDVNHFPTTTFHASDGKLIERMSGYLSPEAFLSSAKALLHGRSPDGQIRRPSGESAEDPMAWLAYGNSVFGRNEYVDEAIKSYVWLLDHADEKSPGFLDQHLDLVLMRMMYCARINPRAEDMLVSRRDGLRAKAFEGKASDSEVLAILRYNYWLLDPVKSSELYLELGGLGERQEQYRNLIFDPVLPELVAWQRYEAIRDGGGDIVGTMHSRYQEYGKRFEAAREAGTTSDTSVLAELNALREGMSADTEDYYEALLAVGKGGDAEKLAQEYLTLFPTADSYAGLMLRAARLDLKEVVKRLSERGEQAVPDSDPRKQRLARILARVEAGEKLGRKPGARREEPAGEKDGGGDPDDSRRDG